MDPINGPADVKLVEGIQSLFATFLSYVWFEKYKEKCRGKNIPRKSKRKKKEKYRK